MRGLQQHSTVCLPQSLPVLYSHLALLYPAFATPVPAFLLPSTSPRCCEQAEGILCTSPPIQVPGSGTRWKCWASKVNVMLITYHETSQNLFFAGPHRLPTTDNVTETSSSFSVRPGLAGAGAGASHMTGHSLPSWLKVSLCSSRVCVLRGNATRGKRPIVLLLEQRGGWNFRPGTVKCGSGSAFITS